jgi:phenolic acid decarboxylase
VAKVNRLIKKMYNWLEDGKRNINQLFLTTNHTISELYRTESYIEQITVIMQRLEKMLSVQNDVAKRYPSQVNKTKTYAKLINDIVAEFNYLKATNDAMEDNISEIKKSELMQQKMSTRIVDLKKKINKIIYKTENVLSE